MSCPNCASLESLNAQLQAQNEQLHRQIDLLDTEFSAAETASTGHLAVNRAIREGRQRREQIAQLQRDLEEASTENHQLRIACEARADERDAERERAERSELAYDQSRIVQANQREQVTRLREALEVISRLDEPSGVNARCIAKEALKESEKRSVEEMEA